MVSRQPNIYILLSTHGRYGRLINIIYVDRDDDKKWKQLYGENRTKH